MPGSGNFDDDNDGGESRSKTARTLIFGGPKNGGRASSLRSRDSLPSRPSPFFFIRPAVVPRTSSCQCVANAPACCKRRAGGHIRTAMKRTPPAPHHDIAHTRGPPGLGPRSGRAISADARDRHACAPVRLRQSAIAPPLDRSRDTRSVASRNQHIGRRGTARCSHGAECLVWTQVGFGVCSTRSETSCAHYDKREPSPPTATQSVPGPSETGGGHAMPGSLARERRTPSNEAGR